MNSGCRARKEHVCTCLTCSSFVVLLPCLSCHVPSLNNHARVICGRILKNSPGTGMAVAFGSSSDIFQDPEIRFWLTSLTPRFFIRLPPALSHFEETCIHFCLISSRRGFCTIVIGSCLPYSRYFGVNGLSNRCLVWVGGVLYKVLVLDGYVEKSTYWPNLDIPCVYSVSGIKWDAYSRSLNDYPNVVIRLRVCWPV